MMLDTLGVGLLGTRTAVFNKALSYCQLFTSERSSSVWGRSDVVLPPPHAAFVNGIAVHSMDFDDTWHPATHPSGAVLPALLALADALPVQPSGLDLLLAFNVGIEVQGRLMRFSREASNIPERFHPPSVVGVMGSAAASAKLLGLSAAQCSHALAIAASSAGAPLANAATQTKPLHVGNAAQRGLEAAQLAGLGLEGSPAILDARSGLGVYYTDYSPSAMEVTAGDFKWILEEQDVAFKRIPAHLAMHWAVDAALAARAKLQEAVGGVDLGQIRRVTLRAPPSKYIDCPSPASEHQARHSFQFSVCSALTDGEVTAASYGQARMGRPALRGLLAKVRLETPADNRPDFDRMYCEVEIETAGGGRHAARCEAFYGHWRRPLSQEHLLDKFSANASAALRPEGVAGLAEAVGNIERVPECSVIGSYLRMASHNRERAHEERM
ncbi:cis-aconitate decarboxylase isoform 2-T2 [Menidia menidia]